MELKYDKTIGPQKLKYQDCRFAMMDCFERIRAMPREKVLNLVIELAIQQIDAFSAQDLDTETRGVLAVHLVRDLLEKRSENHLKDLPGDADQQEEEEHTDEQLTVVIQ